jgi:nicotinate-nucleotide adenylyltransferase
MAKSPANVRLELVRLAAQNEARVEPSDLEIKRGGKSYTLDTLLELQKRYPGAELFLVLGSDTLGDLPNWHRPKKCSKSLPCCAFRALDFAKTTKRRGRTSAPTRKDSPAHRQGGPHLLYGGARTPRRRLGYHGAPAGRGGTACYENGVYFPPEIQQMQQKLRAALSQKRYRHVCGTMRAAACLAQVGNRIPEGCAWRRSCTTAQSALIR